MEAGWGEGTAFGVEEGGMTVMAGGLVVVVVVVGGMEGGTRHHRTTVGAGITMETPTRNIPQGACELNNPCTLVLYKSLNWLKRNLFFAKLSYCTAS